MTVQQELTQGRWWRFTRYEVRDDFIRPAQGAQLLEWNPWTDHLKLAGEAGLVQPPYLSLLRLLEKLRPPKIGRSLDLSPEDQTLICEWCAKHGLLGILSHRVQAITLPARWQPIVEESSLLQPTSRAYLRTSSDWRTISRAHIRGTGDGRVEGAIVGEHDLPAGCPRPGVIIRKLGHPKWEQEDLDQSWATYFPDVPREQAAEYQYPRPHTEAFWRLYAEPVKEFIAAAARLRDAIEPIEKRKPVKQLSEREGSALIRGLEMLTELTAPVSITVDVDLEGQPFTRWVSPALLSSFAAMAVQDLCFGRHIRECQACRKPFVSDAWQALYCTEQCRWRAQQQRHREQVRKRTKSKKKRSSV